MCFCLCPYVNYDRMHGSTSKCESDLFSIFRRSQMNKGAMKISIYRYVHTSSNHK